MSKNMVESVGKSLAMRLPMVVAVLLVPAFLRAADIEGTLSVPKPDRAVVYVDGIAGTLSGAKAKLDQRNKIFSPWTVVPFTTATHSRQRTGAGTSCTRRGNREVKHPSLQGRFLVEGGDTATVW